MNTNLSDLDNKSSVSDDNSQNKFDLNTKNFLTKSFLQAPTAKKSGKKTINKIGWSADKKTEKDHLKLPG